MRAFIGKIFITFIPFPFQSDLKPSYLTTFWRQSVIPLYWRGFLKARAELDWVCRISFTLSVGATVVLAMVAEIPPKRKFKKKFSD